MHTPSQKAKLRILKECRKVNLYLDRIENKLDRKCMSNLNGTEYDAEFDRSNVHQT